MNKIVLICVDYNSANETNDYISNLLLHFPIEIVLVCNSGSDDISNTIKQSKRVHIYEYGANLGYMQAAHRGLMSYLETNMLPEWVILSNTDIEFQNLDFFDKLFLDNRFDKILAPRIETLDKSLQNPFLSVRPSKRKLEMLCFIYSYQVTYYIYSFLSLLKKKYKFKNANENNLIREIYAPHGSFIILGRAFFEKGNTIEHPTFLYGEELFIAERARLSEIKILYTPEYKILHKEHVATKNISNFAKARYMKKSIQHILSNFFQ